MSCDRARKRLMRMDSRAASGETRAHLEACSSCSTFARRLEAAQLALRDHRSEYVPDTGFTRRVLASLPAEPDLIGWAALRLLPVTLALTLVLSAWCWLATPGPREMFEPSPTDDLLAWALGEDGS